MKGLEEAIAEHSDLQVDLLGELISFIRGRDFALAKGKEHHASIVLWGSIGRSETNVQVTANFEVLDSPVYFSSKLRNLSKDCGRESITKSFVSAAQELNEFTLQIDFAKQMSALTLMTIGIALLKAGDYNISVVYFDQALSEWGKQDE
jgi:hypothetical protein